MVDQDRPARPSGRGGVAVQEPVSRPQAEPDQQGVAEQAKERVQEVGRKAAESAEEVAREQQRSLAGHLDSLAKAVRYASERLRQDNEDWLAEYGEQAASSIEQFRGSLESQEPRQVLDQLEDYGRRSPQSFMEIALLGGFLIGRFLKSSGSRPAASGDRPSPAPMETVPSRPAPGPGEEEMEVHE